MVSEEDSGTPVTAATVQALEARLRRCEDQLALYQLIMTYGPSVDSGSSEIASALWTEDGLYDAQISSWTGRQAIAEMIDGPGHQSLIHNGAAHVAAMPLLSIDEDSAHATCYFHLYLRDGDGFRPWRVTATRWEFVRRADGWRVTSRVNRLLDGGEQARQLLRRAVE
jgi:SnoaL-like domain